MRDFLSSLKREAHSHLRFFAEHRKLQRGKGDSKRTGQDQNLMVDELHGNARKLELDELGILNDTLDSGVATALISIRTEHA